MKIHISKVIYISIISMLFIAIANTNLGVISQFASQNGNEWIGSASVSMIFLGAGLGTWYNSYIHKYQFKWIIFVGAMGWNIYVSFSVIFLFIGFSNLIIVIILSGSLLCGLIISIYYNGTGNYVSQCGCKDGKMNLYFGINTCLMQSANIVGSSISWGLIEPLGQQVYSFVMLGLAVGFSFAYLFVRQFDCSILVNQPSLMSAQHDGQDAVQTVDKLQNNGNQQQDDRSKIPLVFYFCFAMSGIMISFVYGQLSLLFYNTFDQLSKQQLNSLTFRAFLVEGCGQFFGGLTLVLLSSRLQSITNAYLVNGGMFMGTIVLLWYGFESQQQWIIFIGVFLAGLADSFCYALALSISGRWNQPGISLFNFSQSITVSLITILCIFLELKYLFLIYLLIYIASIVTLFKFKHLIDSPSPPSPSLSP